MVHKDDKAVYAHLEDVLNAPSLYDVTLKLLADRGFNIPSKILDRDFSQAYVPAPEIEEIWREIYSEADNMWDLYTLGEKITALEYYFQEWRFKHMKTVSRVIGYKKGTAGSAGVAYLVKALDNSFFPELWSMRSQMTSPEDQQSDKCPI